MSFALTHASRERDCHACFKSEKPLIHVIRDERYGMTKSAFAPCLPFSGGTNIIMNNIIDLVKSGVTGLTLNIKIEDLVEFSKHVINEAKEALLTPMVKESQEKLLPKAEVLEKFNICPTTLWNWERKKYIESVKIGRKIYFRQADVECLIIERGRR